MSGLDFFKQETAKKTIVKEERKEVDAVKPLNYLGETETSKDFFRDVAANIKSRENTPALGVENLAQRNVEGRPYVDVHTRRAPFLFALCIHRIYFSRTLLSIPPLAAVFIRWRWTTHRKL